MLLREHFCRSHHRSLVSIHYDSEKGKCRYDCLTGPHISLYQSRHHVFPLHILHYFFPHTHLCTCQFIRQWPEHSVCFFRWYDIEIIFHTFIIFFQLSYRQNKFQKFFKHQPFSCTTVYFFILWKVYTANCIIVLCQFVFHTEFLWQPIFRQIQLFYRLTDRFYRKIIGKSCRQRILWLQCTHFQLIRIRRIKDLRMLQYQTIFSSHHMSTQNDWSTCRQCAP